MLTFVSMTFNSKYTDTGNSLRYTSSTGETQFWVIYSIFR